MPKRTAKTAHSAALVTFLLDKSGSMAAIRDDTIGAFNTYLQTLKESGEDITFSFLQFDSMSIDTVCKNTAVGEVAPLTEATFVPRASTPLIDAAYKTIKAVEEALTKRDVQPKVIICIQTDGHENCSTAHTWADLNALIKEKSALGWQFNFMGAGIDAYEQGRKMGVSAECTLSYDSKDRAATRAAFAATAMNTASFSAGLSCSTAYDARQKAASGDAFRARVQGLQQPNPDLKKAKSLVDDISL